MCTKICRFALLVKGVIAHWQVVKALRRQMDAQGEEGAVLRRRLSTIQAPTGNNSVSDAALACVKVSTPSITSSAWWDSLQECSTHCANTGFGLVLGPVGK